MIYYVPHTVIYVTERGGRVRFVSATDGNPPRTTLYSVSVRRFPSGVLTTGQTFYSRWWSVCSAFAPLHRHHHHYHQHHIRILYNLQCLEPSDRNSFIVFGTRRVHLKRQFRGGQLFRTELERTPIYRPT